MHGRAGEERKRGQHMWTDPTRGNSVVAGDVSSSSSSVSPTNSFYKDGREISVGDCALFKPPQDSPPFIGIIRSLTNDKDNKLKLGVNWLYRPAEVKLGKGILLGAAPNEIFYSFHKDEIPAASLLHPCKVAFLSKGVELPSGICSYVCRRVYDITNKCLWWLTDQDYINERQGEVDQLLYKTRVEMHATVQPGVRSPKPINGPTSTSQQKPGSDSLQNSASSFPSQVKGKKREWGDQSSEPVKRERTMKMNDGDSSNCRPENIWKFEIAKFTEKGGLVDSEGVERLVQLMLPERNEKKIDLVGRSILAGVVAATDKLDCLNRFVQLRGLLVFDEWLQEVHKGKIGDSSSPKDGDKSIEELLHVLLCALDKLPVNLHALQMCNIGKSVNHLRSHKNSEIQKKARSLVDTWKRGVEAEMDAKSGSNQAVSWPARPRLPEVSHGGNRNSGLSSEVAMKSSCSQLSASKIAPVKLAQVETLTKSASASASSGSMKLASPPTSVGNSSKEGQPRNAGVSGASDLPLMAARDEKSSSSSQSPNNSQSCSSDPAKTVGLSRKEDRSSTAVSMTANKIIGGSSRHRKSINGFQGSAQFGVQRESGSSRSCVLHKNPGSEKLLQSSLTCEKAIDVPTAGGSNHKLIVEIPNRGSSPAQSISGGSFEDPSVMNSRASSPALSEKHDQFDHGLKEKSDAYQANNTSDVNTESWQSNDFKEVLTGSDEGGGSPTTVADEGHCKTDEDTRKLAEISKDASPSSGNGHKLGKLHDGYFSSMNALIESCVKYSEANPSMSVGDDVGMNLLASVAAGEMSKSDVVLPKDSLQRNSPVIEHSSAGIDSRVKLSPSDELARDQSQSVNGVDDEHEKLCIAASTSLDMDTDGKTISFSQEKPTGALNVFSYCSSMDVQQITEPCPDSNVKSEETLIGASAAVPSVSTIKKTTNGGGKEPWEERAGGTLNTDGISDTQEKFSSSFGTENKINVSEMEVEAGAIGGPSSSYPSLENDVEKNKYIIEKSDISVQAEQKPPAMACPGFAKGTVGEVLQPSGSGKDMVSEDASEVKTEEADETDGGDLSTGKQKIEQESNTNSVVDHKGESMEQTLEGNLVKELHGGPAPHESSNAFVQKPELRVTSRDSKWTGIEANEDEECASATADASLSATGGLDVEAKVEFDLNEGFNADDGKYGEPNNLRTPECSATIQLICPSPVPSVPGSLPTLITVAAAAKGVFVPPEDLLKNKGELRWKGSAATSAFRPAEPRKVSETPLGTSNISHPVAIAAKPYRLPLDIDLNVPDERILEDLASRSGTDSASDLTNNHNLARKLMDSAPVCSFGGLDLDLNRVDEATDIGGHLPSNGHRLEVHLQPGKSSSSRYPNGEVTNRRNFDLNDGSLIDEIIAEPSPFGQHKRNTAPSQSSVSGLWTNNTEIGNFSSWYPRGNPYPGVTIQHILPDRVEQPFLMVAPGGPQRMLAPPTGSTPFSPDVYRAPVLSSPPAMPFLSTPFQYPVFPFGTSFPLPSVSLSGSSATYADSTSGGRLFPTGHSQALAPAGVIPSQYPRPFVSLSDNNNNNATENSRKWARQGLDLNAGPLGPDIEGRDETPYLATRQLSVASSQAFAEEHSRVYQVAGGSILKRKDPEGGWEVYKQSSWQ